MSTILNPLYFAVSWVLVGFHKLFGYIFGQNNHESLKWTLSIVGLVVLIRIILIPLFVRQIKSQRTMQVLQPKIKEIQKRYKDDRQKQSEEMMKLYKEHKTNPLASCFPLLAQAPIFFALFTVLNGIAKGHPHGFMRGAELESARTAKLFGVSLSASFLNSHGLSPKIVSLGLIFIMGLAQFVTQKQLMTKGMAVDTSNTMMMQQQKIMLYVLPVILTLSGVNFPVGVLIYWSVSNFWAFGQQMYVIKRNPTPGSPAHAEWEKKKAQKIEKAGGTVIKSDESEKDSEATETGEQKGQRNQPKKNPKKKRK